MIRLNKNMKNLIIPFIFTLASCILYASAGPMTFPYLGGARPVYGFTSVLILLISIGTILGFEVVHIRDKKKYRELLQSFTESLESINHLNHRETGEHTERVGLYSELLAREAGLSKVMIREIRVFAPLHDLGKVAVSNTILDKPGSLTKKEIREMRTHTVKGAEILKRLKNISTKPELAVNIVLHHHEKWNGRGYPHRLQGEEIPIEARIVAIADVYDALRMSRSYKRSYSHEEASRIILRGRGEHFDPALVDIFQRKQTEFDAIYTRKTSSKVISIKRKDAV